MAALTAKSMFPICKDPSREERYQICSLLKAKQTISEIARLLGRSRSTVSRNARRMEPKPGLRSISTWASNDASCKFQAN
jgi:IS30 family transposase